MFINNNMWRWPKSSKPIMHFANRKRSIQLRSLKFGEPIFPLLAKRINYMMIWLRNNLFNCLQCNRFANFKRYKLTKNYIKFFSGLTFAFTANAHMSLWYYKLNLIIFVSLHTWRCHKTSHVTCNDIHTLWYYIHSTP